MSWTLKQQVMKVTVIMTVSQVVPRIYTVRPERNFRMSSFFCCIGNFVTYTTKRSTQSFFEHIPTTNRAERKKENVKRISQQNNGSGK